MAERVAAARAAVTRPAALTPRALNLASGMLTLGSPTQIGWILEGNVGTYRAISGGGGGDGLPTGWTEDSANPANVFTNGVGSGGTGSLIVGIEGADEQVEIDSTGIVAHDELGNQYLVVAPGGIILQPVTVGGAAITIDDGEGATVALDGGGLPVENLADGVNPSDAATVGQLPAPGGGDYVLLDTVTLGADGVIDITGIDQGYSDLILAGMIRGTNGGDETLFSQINGDTGNNYEYEALAWSSGSGVVRFGNNTVSFMNLGDHAIPSTGSNLFAAFEMTIIGYSSTTWRKSIKTHVTAPLSGDGTNQITGAEWQSTAAVTRVKLYGGFTANLQAGSSIRVYGRK